MQTIARFLEREHYTAIKQTGALIQWNTPAVKEERRIFFEWLMDECLHRAQKQQPDNCGHHRNFSVRTSRHF